MDPRGIPIDQLQVLFWGMLESLTGVNPGEYIKQGGAKLGQIKPILTNFLEMWDAVEEAAVDGLVSWDEIDRVLVEFREMVAAAKDAFA